MAGIAIVILQMNNLDPVCVLLQCPFATISANLHPAEVRLKEYIRYGIFHDAVHPVLAVYHIGILIIMIMVLQLHTVFADKL